MELAWIFVDAGTCLFGDRARPVEVPALWWTATTITRAQVSIAHREGMGEDEGALPVTGVDQGEATAIAQTLGGRLPRSVEWEWMAAGPKRRVYPWGEADWTPRHANLRGSGHGRAVPPGSCRAGATPQGLLEVAGNVWEWTASPVLGGGAVLRGGSYNSLPLYARCRFLNAAPRWLRSPGIGMRVVREP